MSDVRIVSTAYINGRPYKTAKMAAKAFADGLMNRRVDRHSKKIGCAAYHDKAWWDRQTKGMTLVTYGAITMREGESDEEKKAYRRVLPIFKKYLP